MNAKMIENAKEVRDLVYLALQEHTDWVTSSTIANELGLGREQVKTALHKLKTEHPEIVSSKSFGYKITAPKKNSEGYSDPTAMAAINKVDAELAAKVRNDDTNFVAKKEYNHSFYGTDYDDILPGTLWETSSSNGNADFFFVVSNMVNGAPVAFGLNVYPQDLDGYPDRKVDVIIDSVVSGVYVGDVSCLRSKPMKYFMGEVTIMRSSETLSMVKSAISKLLGFDESLKLEYEAGYQNGLKDGKECEDYKKALDEQHKEALAEEHQRGLREGTDKGYDTGYKDGYDTAKKELDYCKNDAIATEEAFHNLESKPEEKPVSDVQPLTIDDADVVQLITERNLYKTFYEQLLEVMKS